MSNMPPANTLLKKSFSDYKVRYSAAGVHLFDRLTGNNILLDEAEIPKDLWARAPRQVSIALTNACDLECSHCYAPKHKARLETEQLKIWLRDLDRHGCLGVGFGGGEPTVHPNFLEICEFAAQQTSLAVTMTTHGHRLTQEFLNQLSGNMHFVRISMDGIGSVYEKIRGRKFQDLISKIILVKEKFPFGINFVVNSDTITCLNDSVNLAEDLGAREFLLLPEEGIRRGVGITNDIKVKLQNWVRNYSGKMKLTISSKHTAGISFCDPFFAESILDAYLHIDAGGILRANSYAYDGISLNDKNIISSIEKMTLGGM